MRGMAVIFMMMGHVNAKVHSAVASLNPDKIAFFSVAHIFVFLAGFGMGLVTAIAHDRSGHNGVWQLCWKSIRRIWLFHAGLVLLLAALALALPLSAHSLFAPYREEPQAVIGLSLAMLTGSAHMGLLPMYIIFILFVPWAVSAMASGRAATVVLASAGLWCVAQTNLAQLPMQGLQHLFGALAINLHAGLYFNLLGWQLLFFGGLVIGRIQQRQQLPIA